MTDAMDRKLERTYVEIDLNVLQQNVKRIRALAGGNCRIMQVLKADAYGHGAGPCAKYAAPYVDWFAVATFEEALAVRNAAPDTPVLLFGQADPAEFETAVWRRITLTVPSVRYAEELSGRMTALGRTADVHIKLETGMNRQGITVREDSDEDAVCSVRRICTLPGLHVTGIYTHMSCADTEDPSDCRFTAMQYDRFVRVTDALTSEGISLGLRHCVSTGGLLCHPEYKLDMVRIGMLGYGQSISKRSILHLGIEPILTWKARIIDIRKIKAGESVSYGRMYTAEKDEEIAVLAAGYADGYSRDFSNVSKVIADDTLCPVRGKTCMDFTMIDVSACRDIKPGDEAILLGRSETHWLSADDLTCFTRGNTNVGITAGINERVPRYYLYDGKVIGCRRKSYEVKEI